MKPQAAGHTTARPPQAPGDMGASGRTYRQDQRPGEQPGGKSARPSSGPVTPRRPASGCFLWVLGENKQDGQTLQAERGGRHAGGRVASVLGDENGLDLTATKTTSDGFSPVPTADELGRGRGAQVPWSLGRRGQSRVRDKGGGSQDVAVMSTRDQNLPSTPRREDKAEKLTGGPQDSGKRYVQAQPLRSCVALPEA